MAAHVVTSIGKQNGIPSTEQIPALLLRQTLLGGMWYFAQPLIIQ